MIACALVTNDESLRRHVRSLMQSPDSADRLVLELTESAAEMPRDRLTDILAANPDVVFVDLGTSAVELRVLEALSEEAPDMTLIAAGPTLSADALLRVVRAGASEYLPRPFSADDVAAALRRVRRRADTTRADEATEHGRLTTLFSPKGGVGTTTVAVNLAVILRQLSEESTLMLDLSPRLGTAALMVGLHPRYSYLDVIQNFHRMDRELFRSFLEEHESGVHVLASPPGVRPHSEPSMDEILALVRFCRRNYVHVVVDAGHALIPAAEAALLDADDRLLVSTPELPTLRNLKRVLEVLAEYTTNGKAPPSLVLNQYVEGVGVSVAEVEKGLGILADTVIPRDASLVTESINLGRPAVLMKRSPFERAVTELAGRIAGPAALTVQRGGLLKTLLKPFRSNGSGVATKEAH